MAPLYPVSETGLLLVDPYNDFLSVGGKLYEPARAVIESVGTVANMREVLAAARAKGIRVFYVPHHRAKPNDFSGWRHASPYLLAGHKAQACLIFIGLLANTCIETTAKYAAELGYHVTLVSDASAAFTPEAMRGAHAINGPTYAHQILTTAELIAALRGAAQSA